ncbi:MAG: LysM peptidoglycan-binding domain-containing protein, partial [Mesorhizobium sp.]|nr:LysM peptidoglycan-binding domain-containing protein [Mesorhizobium sp.]
PAAAAPAAPAAAPAATTASEPAAPAANTHVIVKGDNYWNLAVKLLGDGHQWKKIAEANPSYKPKALPIGATLTLPAKN